jgi:hypothetical protein
MGDSHGEAAMFKSYEPGARCRIRCEGRSVEGEITERRLEPDSPRFLTAQEESPLNILLPLGLSLALLLAVLGLVHQFRLRWALQALLVRLINRWRPRKP